MVRKGKSIEQIEKEVKEEMPGASRSEQITEIRRRMDAEGKNVNYYFNQMGIEPTQVIEFEVGEGLDMVSFINDFYNHPDRYTSMLIKNEEQTL